MQRMKMRRRLQALRRHTRTRLAVPALLVLLGLLALTLLGRFGIGAGSGADTRATQPATTGSATITTLRLAGVRVPDVEGRSLAEARRRFAEVGLPASAYEADPTGPGSVVVSQEPAAGTLVPRGSVVGLRTALVTEALCAALVGVPDTDGGFAPAPPGLLDRLDAAARVAPSELRPSIRTIVSWQRAHPAMTIDGWPPEALNALDRLLVHRRACARR